jgi:hypothetical protein
MSEPVRARRTRREALLISENLGLDLDALCQRTGLSKNQLFINGLKLLMRHSVRFVKPTTPAGERLISRWKEGDPDEI